MEHVFIWTGLVKNMSNNYSKLSYYIKLSMKKQMHKTLSLQHQVQMMSTPARARKKMI